MNRVFSVMLVMLLATGMQVASADASADSAAAEQKAREYFTNLELISQDGERLTYTLNVANVGSSSATGLVVTDVLHRADQDGWLFLTGEPDNVNTVVSRLGQYTEDLEAHSTLLIAANVPEAHWTKIPPTVPPAGVVERLKTLAGEEFGR